MATIAEMYPVQNPDDPWYRSQPRVTETRDGMQSDGGMGWTSNPGYAHVSYGVGDGQGNAFPKPE